MEAEDLPRLEQAQHEAEILEICYLLSRPQNHVTVNNKLAFRL